MARLARIVAGGVPHHITQRGNRRQLVFFKPEDYQNYIELMAERCNRWQVEIWAYCLMPNHVHLIAVPERENGLARAIGEAHRRYTRMVNLREGWRGYLWQGRFASYPLDDIYLLTAVRYTELNPVRAGLVKNAWEYLWSSALSHIQGRDDLLVRAKPLIEIVGNWKEFLNMEVNSEEVELLQRHTRTGRPLGDENFIETLQKRLNRILRPSKPGPKKSKDTT